MSNRVTLQEIADSLGLSRNTVSRALNNTGNVSATTRNKICQAAVAMGYKQFVSTDTAAPTVENHPLTAGAKSEIALFTHAFPGSSHSGTKMLEAFHHKVDALGYKLSINIIRDYEINNLCFPANIDLDKQDIPLLFVDTPITQKCNINADVLLMENLSSVYHMLNSLIASGNKKISFVGDRYHCQSFYERWQAYVSVLTDNGKSVDVKSCILADDSSPYSDAKWLSEQIAALPTLPDLFFCANDFLAMSVLKALRLLGKKIPEEIRICGFDDAPESTLTEPSLTTVKIHSSSMGYTAAELLLSRIANPYIPFKKTYIETDIVYRASAPCSK